MKTGPAVASSLGSLYTRKINTLPLLSSLLQIKKEEVGTKKLSTKQLLAREGPEEAAGVKDYFSITKANLI